MLALVASRLLSRPGEGRRRALTLEVGMTPVSDTGSLEQPFDHLSRAEDCDRPAG
jgi:hypothetical protein